MKPRIKYRFSHESSRIYAYPVRYLAVPDVRDAETLKYWLQYNEDHKFSESDYSCCYVLIGIKSVPTR